MGGTPIVADKFYGTKQTNRRFKGVYGMQRHFLHAYVLGFRHPVTRDWVEVVSPLPPDLRGLLDRLPPRSDWRAAASEGAALADMPLTVLTEAAPLPELLEGTITRRIREDSPPSFWRPAGKCRTELRAAQLRLVAGLLMSNRLTEHCPLLISADVCGSIGAWFQSISEQRRKELDELLLDAAMEGDAAAIEPLVREGASPDVQGRRVRTGHVLHEAALLLAARGGHAEAVEALLLLGCDVHATNHFGSTALTVASQSGWPACVTALLKGGAAVDAVTDDGHTALYLADVPLLLGIRGGVIDNRFDTFDDRVECARLLLEAGADFTQRYRGGTAVAKAAQMVERVAA